MRWAWHRGGPAWGAGLWPTGPWQSWAALGAPGWGRHTPSILKPPARPADAVACPGKRVLGAGSWEREPQSGFLLNIPGPRAAQPWAFSVVGHATHPAAVSAGLSCPTEAGPPFQGPTSLCCGLAWPGGSSLPSWELAPWPYSQRLSLLWAIILGWARLPQIAGTGRAGNASGTPPPCLAWVW